MMIIQPEANDQPPVDSLSEYENFVPSKREEHDWEDLSASDTVAPSPAPSPAVQLPSPASRVGTPRRRRQMRKAPSLLLRKRSYADAPATPVYQPLRRRLTINTDDWLDGALDVTVSGLRYTVDILGRAIRLMRYPLSLLLFMLMLAFVANKITLTLRTAFSPLCIIPGISNSRFCNPIPLPPPVSKRPKRADYPKMMDIQSKTFEQLLDQSVLGSGSGLSLDIKKAEMATKDLITLVKFSSMKSKDVIADTLLVFINDAKLAGRSLNKLNVKVGGAIDSIAAVNDYALRSIEEAYANAPSMFSPGALIPWSSKPTTREIVTKTFNEAMEVLSTHLKRLILEAEVSLNHLEKLEEALSTLHDIITREDSSVKLARAQLFADLWTILGGNRDKVDQNDSNLALLKDLGSYRKQALAHVVSALQALRSLSDEMEDLRERVSTPELVADIPVEVHMKSIRNGLDRMKEGRIKAKGREELAMRQFLDLGGPE